MPRIMNDSMDSGMTFSWSFLDLADYLGGNSEFCNAVRQRASRHLDGTVQAAATLIEYEFSSLKERSQALNALQARLGRVTVSPDRPHALQLQALLQQHGAEGRRQAKSCRNYAKRIGILVPEAFKKSGYLSGDIPVIEVGRLPAHSIYPPTKHKILEQHYDNLPKPEKPKDRSCSHTNRYHILDESKLQHTVAANESAIIVDKDTKQVVTIIVQGLVRRYFDSVEGWSSRLILKALD